MEGAVYSVRVKTGNRKGAGTDAKVFLTITGKNNEKGWDTYLYTRQRENCFDKLELQQTSPYPRNLGMNQL